MTDSYFPGDEIKRLVGQYISNLYDKGWRIENTSCMCGGNWAWMRETERGTRKMFGCVCHHIPEKGFARK